jgi:hypothetical protein
VGCVNDPLRGHGLRKGRGQVDAGSSPHQGRHATHDPRPPHTLPTFAPRLSCLSAAPAAPGVVPRADAPSAAAWLLLHSCAVARLLLRCVAATAGPLVLMLGTIRASSPLLGLGVSCVYSDGNDGTSERVCALPSTPPPVRAPPHPHTLARDEQSVGAACPCAVAGGYHGCEGLA